MLQTFGLDSMGAYPYVRAAIIGHANRASPNNCKQVKKKTIWGGEIREKVVFKKFSREKRIV